MIDLGIGIDIGLGIGLEIEIDLSLRIEIGKRKGRAPFPAGFFTPGHALGAYSFFSI